MENLRKKASVKAVFAVLLALFLSWQFLMPAKAFAKEVTQTVEGTMTITVSEDSSSGDDTNNDDDDSSDDSKKDDGDTTDDSKKDTSDTTDDSNKDSGDTTDDSKKDTGDTTDDATKDTGDTTDGTTDDGDTEAADEDGEEATTDEATEDGGTIKAVDVESDDDDADSAESAGLAKTGDSLLWMALGFLAIAAGVAYVAHKSRILVYARGTHSNKAQKDSAKRRIIAVSILAAVLAGLCFGACAPKTSAIADDETAKLASTTSTVTVDSSGNVKSSSLTVESLTEDYDLTITAVTAPSTPAQFGSDWTSGALNQALATKATVTDKWNGKTIPSSVLETAKKNGGKTTVEYSVTVTYYENDSALTNETGKVTLPDPSTGGDSVIYVKKVDTSTGETKEVPLENVTVEVDKDGNISIKFDENSDPLGDDEEVVVEVKKVVDNVEGDPIPNKQVTVTDKDGGKRGPTETGEDGKTSSPGSSGVPDDTGATKTTDPTSGKRLETTVTYKDSNSN